MPRRTNAFQAVVFMIKTHVAGNAKVMESTLLTDLITGKQREVDMCIETEAAGHAVLVGIECRDQSRMQSVSWVDEMYGKHHRLPTDHLVLVSSSGFTRQALEVARLLNIETVVPEVLTEDRAAEIAAHLNPVRVGKLELVQVNQVRVIVEAIDEPILVPPELGEMPLCSDTGEPIVRIRDVVHAMITGYYSADQILVNPPESIDSMNLHYDNLRYSYKGEQTAAYLRLPDGSYSRLVRLTFTGEVRHTLSDVPMRYGQLQHTVYSWGELILDEKPAVIVATQDQDGATTISLRTLPG